MRLTRRDFLKVTGAGATAAMLYRSDIIKKALDIIMKKVGAYERTGTNIVWLQGQCCTGCSISLIQWCGEYDDGTYYTNIVDLLNALGISKYEPVPLDFHPTLDFRAGVYYSADGSNYQPYTCVVSGLQDKSIIINEDLTSYTSFNNATGKITIDYNLTYNETSTSYKIQNGSLLINITIDSLYELLYHNTTGNQIWNATSPVGTINLSTGHVSVSFTNSSYIGKNLTSVYANYHNIKYVGSMPHLFETLNETTGEVIVVIEGAIPPAMIGDMETTFCEVGMKQNGTYYKSMWQFEELVAEVANYSNVNIVIAYGSCAAFGGIPHGNPNPTGTRSVMERLREHGINKIVINIPGCPAHPEWLVLTLAAYIQYKTSGGNLSDYIQLDGYNRPAKVSLDGGTTWIEIFARPNHYNCERYSSFNSGNVASSFQDAIDNPDKCLVKLGCRGMIAYADCPARKWNRDPDNPVVADKNPGNWCVGAGSPCNACVDPQYPDFEFWREPKHWEWYEGGMLESVERCYWCHRDAKK